MTHPNSFGARVTWAHGGQSYDIFRLSAVDGASRLPFSLKVLLENLLRTEDGANVTADSFAPLRSGTPPPSQVRTFSSPPRES